MAKPIQITEGVRWCKCHCVSCDECFASLAAFDAHRRGSHYRNTRHCCDPASLTRAVDDEPLLEGIEGKCRHANERGIWVTTVWRYPRSEDE